VNRSLARLQAMVAHPSALLLITQLLIVVLYPFLESSRGGSATLSVLSMVAVGMAVRVVRSTQALTLVAVLIGGPAVAISVAEVVVPGHDWMTVTSALLHAPFYFYVAYSTIRYLFHDNRVTVDELWAIGAAFTVIAWAFAYLFLAVETLVPGSVSPHQALQQGETPFFQLLFLSFTNLTSVGLSDLVPSSSYLRSVLMLEQVAGVLYIAMVVSRLVALSVRRD
jgi:hypothetical protein